MGYSQALEQQAEMYRFAIQRRGLAGMVVSVETPTGWQENEAKKLLLESAGAMLRDGEPFYWDATTCALVRATAPEMPAMTLRPEDLITPFGFCWFARPLPVTVPDGFSPALPMLGYAWGVAAGRGVMLMPFSPSPQRLAGAPTQFTMWAYGDSLENLSEHVRTLARKDTFIQDSEIQALRRVEQMRYIAACIVFMNQRILVQHKERADRNTRRRLERSGWTHEPDVRVVTLRRAQTDTGRREPGSEPVEWSCQWVVSGHWRQQLYPSSGEHRPVFVLPYIKGPSDKPLKASAQRVFAVTR